MDPRFPAPQGRARPGNAGIDVYHIGVCAEGPPFLSQIDVFGWGSNRKKSQKEPYRYARFRGKSGPWRPDFIVYQVLMWSTLEEYAILTPKRFLSLPETPGFPETAVVASGYHRL